MGGTSLGLRAHTFQFPRERPLCLPRCPKGLPGETLSPLLPAGHPLSARTVCVPAKLRAVASGMLCQGLPAPTLSSPSDETLAPGWCENIERSGFRPRTRPVSSTNGVTMAAHTGHSELMTCVKYTINTMASSTFKLSPSALRLKRRCPGASPGSSPWGWDRPLAPISCSDLGDGWRAGGCRGRGALVSSA